MQVQGEAPAAAAAVSLARGRMHLVSAAVWRRHGCASLAAAEAASFLACHALDPDDTLHAYATLALIANDLQGAAAPVATRPATNAAPAPSAQPHVTPCCAWRARDCHDLQQWAVGVGHLAPCFADRTMSSMVA